MFCINFFRCIVPILRKFYYPICDAVLFSYPIIQIFCILRFTQSKCFIEYSWCPNVTLFYILYHQVHFRKGRWISKNLLNYDFIQKFDYSSSNYTLQRYLFKIFSIEELISIQIKKDKFCLKEQDYIFQKINFESWTLNNELTTSFFVLTFIIRLTLNFTTYHLVYRRVLYVAFKRSSICSSDQFYIYSR